MIANITISIIYKGDKIVLDITDEIKRILKENQGGMDCNFRTDFDLDNWGKEIIPDMSSFTDVDVITDKIKIFKK